MNGPTPYSNRLLAAGTLLAALFVAIQAWYARTAYLDAAATRAIEARLDICFDNFDDAAELDAALRFLVPGMMEQGSWPPKVVIESPAHLVEIQRGVAPKLDALEAGLTKASVLGQLDKYREFLAQQVRGLSKALLDVPPSAVSEDNPVVSEVQVRLSDLLGAQYLVFTGCRELAEAGV